MKSDRIVVNDRVYKLQYPGNREWLKIKKTLLDVRTAQIDIEPLLDYCFEHVVFPETGNKLDLDTIDILEVEEVWAVILPAFLQGKLDAGYVYPEDRKTEKAASKLLQKTNGG